LIVGSVLPQRAEFVPGSAADIPPGARSFNYAELAPRASAADDVLEMLPLGGRPDLGVGVSVTAHDRRYFCCSVAVGSPEDVEIITGTEYGVAADPFDLGTIRADVVHRLALKLFEGSRRLQ